MASATAATGPTASPAPRAAALPTSAACRGGGTAVNASVNKPKRALTGRDQFIYVWLELIETQHVAVQAAASIKLPDGSEAAHKLKELLATTQRVSALIDSADEMLYMHVLPSGKDVAAPTSKAEPASAAKEQEEPRHNGHGCCCCCPSRSGGSRPVGEREAKSDARGYSTRSSVRASKPRRSHVDSDSERDDDGDDGDEDEDEGRGRRRNRVQRRKRTRHDHSDDDRSFSREDDIYGNDERLHDALIANRIRMSHSFERISSSVTPEHQASATGTRTGSSRHGQRSSTPRNGGNTNSATSRGRSPARTDRPHGSGSTSPGRRHHRRPGAQSPVGTGESSNGKKRKRSPADRQASPSHRRASPGPDLISAPPDDGVERMSKSRAANLTAEKVLGMRWNFSQKEFKIKWVELDKPSWIARRKCPAQAAQMIEMYVKTQRKQEKAGKRQQKSSAASASRSAHKSKSGSKSSKKAKQDSGAKTDDLFTVEKLIDVRTKYNKRQFLVRWDGYDSSEDTWEYVEELRKYVPDIVKDYEAQLKRKRQRKAEDDRDISRQTQKKETPARDEDSDDDEGADEHEEGDDEEAVDEEQQRMLQVIRGGPDADEEEDDDLGQRDCSDDEERDDRSPPAAGGQLTLYSQGRYSKPMYSGRQDSDDDDDGDDGDEAELEREDEHELDEDMDDNDDDDDDDRVSVDFSGDTGIRKYSTIAPSRASTGSSGVMESAKELLRRLRA